MQSNSSKSFGPVQHSINPLKTRVYSGAGVNGNCVLQQNQIIFNGLKAVYNEVITKRSYFFLYMHYTFCSIWPNRLVLALHNIAASEIGAHDIPFMYVSTSIPVVLSPSLGLVQHCKGE